MRRDIISEENSKRIVAFSDSVIAVAITLLVLQIPIPIKAPGKYLLKDIYNSIPILISYFVSFITIGRYWYKHITFNNFIKRYDMGLLYLNFLYLLAITYLPFPTAIFGTHSSDKVAVILYASTVAFAGYISFIMWRYAIVHTELLVEDAEIPQLKHASYVSLIIPSGFAFSIIIGIFYPSIVPLVWIVMGIGGSFLHRL